VVQVLEVNRGSLDREYLASWARRLSVTELLEAALAATERS
jgi:hypothetical protein